MQGAGHAIRLLSEYDKSWGGQIPRAPRQSETRVIVGVDVREPGKLGRAFGQTPNILVDRTPNRGDNPRLNGRERLLKPFEGFPNRRTKVGRRGKDLPDGLVAFDPNCSSHIFANTDHKQASAFLRHPKITSRQHDVVDVISLLNATSLTELVLYTSEKLCCSGGQRRHVLHYDDLGLENRRERDEIEWQRSDVILG